MEAHMIQGKWFAPGTPVAGDVISVREAVFGRGTDDLDTLSWNAAVYSDGTPCAAGRIWWEGGAYWLGDICVLESWRGRRLGDLVLRLLLFKAQSHSAVEVRLLAPESVSGFFARMGFQPAGRRGDLVEMQIPGNRIELDTCKNCTKADCPNRQ